MRMQTWQSDDNHYRLAGSYGMGKVSRLTRSPRRRLFYLGMACFWALSAVGVWGQVVQEFYLPMPEAQVYEVFNKHRPYSDDVEMMAVFSIVVTTPDTVIHFDQWESGYEDDLNNPANLWSAVNPGGTQIWGDGNPANGAPPGIAGDILDVGSVIALQNRVGVPARNSAEILFDAGDRIGSTQPITITRVCYEDSEASTQRGTAQASSVEVISTLDHGVRYIAPVGTNILANNMFQFVDLMIMATDTKTNIVTVMVDKDGSGASIQTNTIVRGVSATEPDAFLVQDICSGATVAASGKIQVHMITGSRRVYESRSFVLKPSEQWSSRYIIPIGTVNTNYPSAVFLFNTNASPLVVAYTNIAGGGTLEIPGTDGVLRYNLPKESGTLLESTNGQPFSVICVLNAPTSGRGGSDYDWGFAPLPFDALTTELVCGWGPGWDREWPDPGTPTNGSPVWITALSDTTLHVDFDGDGLRTTNFPIRAYEATRVYDYGDNDQTGMRVFTVDGTLIAGVYGADPAQAEAGQPYLDLGYALVPFPMAMRLKTVTWAKDGDTVYGDVAPIGVYNVEDIVEYRISVINKGLLPLPPVTIYDRLPVQLSYITNSTFLAADGTVTPIPDDTEEEDDTPFPLDNGDTGMTTTNVILRGQSITVSYKCRIVGVGSISNIFSEVTNSIESVVTATVWPASVVEGDDGTTNLVFRVTLDALPEQDVSVSFRTLDGTNFPATAGDDYWPTNGTLVFSATLFETNKFIYVKVRGDTDPEFDETLLLELFDPVGLNFSIKTAVAEGVILNDDTEYTWGIRWRFNPNRDSWFGRLAVTNHPLSQRSIKAPEFWYAFQSNQYHRLRYPTGPLAGEPGWFYLSLNSEFNDHVRLVTNPNPLFDADEFLDPGEHVEFTTDIELWGRSSVTNPAIMQQRLILTWTNRLAQQGGDIPANSGPDEAPASAVWMSIRVAPTPTEDNKGLFAAKAFDSPQGGERNRYVVLEWPGAASWFYTVKMTPSLVPLVPWSNLLNHVGIPGSNGVMSATDTDGIQERRFYRVERTKAGIE